MKNINDKVLSRGKPIDDYSCNTNRKAIEVFMRCLDHSDCVRTRMTLIISLIIFILGIIVSFFNIWIGIGMITLSLISIVVNLIILLIMRIHQE